MKTKFDILYQQILNEDNNIYYHISPFSFEKFDLEKCGSGMGTSFWGYGIYFTKNEEIIDYYYQQMKDSYKNLFKYTVKINSTLISDESKKYTNGILTKVPYKINYSTGHLYNENDLLANDKTVGEIYYQLVQQLSEKEATNIMLNKYHVDGILYYTEEDGNSLVVYNDKIIEILNKKELIDEKEV